MPERDDRFYVRSMLDAVRLSQEFVAGMRLELFLKDAKTQSAVIRQLEIVGEAASRVTRRFRESHPEVPWSKAIGMRNALIHE